MPKRKLSDLEADIFAGGDEKFNRVKATRLGHKFERGSQLLFRALKTARGFERQKLGRRQKTARQENDTKTPERLEKEVYVLKNLDLHETAQRYLLKQLKKTKRIAECLEFVRLDKSVSDSFTSSSGPLDPAEANVTARLFKSNPVQSALPDILSDIRTLLGVDETSAKKQQQTDPRSSTNDEKLKSTTSEVGETTDKSLPKAKSKAEGYLDDVNMDEVSEDESLDLSQFDARLASASDNSDSEGEDDEDRKLLDYSRIKASMNSNSTKHEIPDDISISSAASSSMSQVSLESQTPPPTLVKSQAHKDIKIANTPSVKETTFLPSLTMGGYWSGSESDPDEDDEIVAAATGKAQRKNRMGQQARRALWEKKFGAKAKHLQEKQQSQKDRKSQNKNSGWDARRGATDENDMPKWATGDNKSRMGTASSSFVKGKTHGEKSVEKCEMQTQSSTSKSNGASSKLHPSWEAAKKAKQEKAQATFQGKKITFD